ncbi:MAG: TRAP transporter large permease subunit [Myxococcota bacterium]
MANGETKAPDQLAGGESQGATGEGAGPNTVAPPADATQVAPHGPGHGTAGVQTLPLLKQVENGAVITAFLAMALLSVSEVLGRKLFNKGVPGGMEYVRHLTMWVGFLGALLAAREGKHLALSTAELLPEGRFRAAAHFVAWTVAASVSALASYASWKLATGLRGSGTELGGGVPEWVSVLVMPVSLALVAVHQIMRSSPRWPWRVLCLLVVGLCFSLDFLSAEPVLNPPPPDAEETVSLAKHVAWPGCLVIIVALLLGAPVYAAMAGIAMVLFFAADTPIASVPVETYRLVSSPTLPAVPILTAAGYVLAVGGSSQRLVRLFRAIVGSLPAGLALMVIAVCAIFTTLTGGSGVTILALGGLVYPILRSEKYPENFSLGAVTASGSLGLLFFPSVPVILYAVVAEQPVERLFVAGFVPGVLMILMVCAYAIFVGTRSGVPRQAFRGDELVSAVKEAKWDLGIPLILLGAFATGLATMVEASALAFVYAMIIEVFICRTLKLRGGLTNALVDAGTLVGSVIIVLGMAMGLTSYLVDEGIPEIIINWVKAHITSQVVFLLTLNALLLVLGSVLEIFSAIVILAPLLAPLGNAYGVDPLHLGIIFLANLELGFLFPPVGLNLFLSATRFGKPLPQLYRAAFPFLLIMSFSVLIITYVPGLSTGVVKIWDARSKPAAAQPAAPTEAAPAEPAPAPTEGAPAQPAPAPTEAAPVQPGAAPAEPTP